MTVIDLVAFAGLARSGKDVAAEELIACGFSRMAYGDTLKRFFAPYIAGDESIFELYQRMMAANPLISAEQWEKFYQQVLFPFEEKDLMCDSFTEDDEYKKAFRPILEHGGDLAYDYFLRCYLADVDAALERGERVVNSRIVRLNEAQAWVERGGIIVDVVRAGQQPASSWEQDAYDLLRGSGLISHTLHNDADLAQWRLTAQAFARGLS